MRWLSFILPLLLISPLLYAQQQYSDGACILLQQQIDRFSQRQQNSNYRSAKREYDRYCQQPVQAVPRGAQAQRAVPVVTADTDNVKKALPQQSVPVKVLPPTEAVAETTDSTANDTKPELPVSVAEASTPAEVADIISAPVAIKPKAAVDAEVAEAAPDTEQTPAAKHSEPPVSTLAPEVQDDMLMLVLNSIPLIAANIVALLLIIFLLTSWLGYNLPGFKGVFAEYKLNQLLRWRLSKQYLHFRKLKLLTAKDELTEIDHLVLCPYGIFVIAVSSDRGRISGNETAANWSRYYFGGTRQLMNPLHRNYKNVEAVKHLLQLQDTGKAQGVNSVIAFNRVAQFVSSMPANVMYVDAVAAYLKQFNEPLLSDEQVNRFAAVLKQASTA